MVGVSAASFYRLSGMLVVLGVSLLTSRCRSSPGVGALVYGEHQHQSDGRSSWRPSTNADPGTSWWCAFF
jgi:hypothetical protein